MHTPRVLYTGLRNVAAPDSLALTHLPLLQVTELEVDPAPAQQLLAAGACALLCTSPRAAHALKALRLEPGHHVHQGWAVGQKSREAMAKALPWLAQIHTPPDYDQSFLGLCNAIRDAYHAGTLPPHIIAMALADGPRDLADALADLSGIRITTLHLYTTQPTPPVAARAAIRATGPFDWIVVTSSRGAHALFDALEGKHPGGRLVAIGHTTADALDLLGWPPDLVPPTPILDDLWPLLLPDSAP